MTENTRTVYPITVKAGQKFEYFCFKTAEIREEFIDELDVRYPEAEEIAYIATEWEIPC